MGEVVSQPPSFLFSIPSSKVSQKHPWLGNTFLKSSALGEFLDRWPTVCPVLITFRSLHGSFLGFWPPSWGRDKPTRSSRQLGFWDPRSWAPGCRSGASSWAPKDRSHLPGFARVSAFLRMGSLLLLLIPFSHGLQLFPSTGHLDWFWLLHSGSLGFAGVIHVTFPPPRCSCGLLQPPQHTQTSRTSC